MALFVLPYLLLGLFWVFANPAMAAPDEPDHLVKAVGLARLDIGVPAPPAPEGSKLATVRNASISRVVEIPARLDPTRYACFYFAPEVTAACQPAPSTAEGDRAVTTSLGAYPPFLYPPLGWVASLGASVAQATILARLLVLAASTLLLALACDHLVRWLGPRSLVGPALLLTPMGIFCMGIINTSAVEILGALGMACVVVVYSRHPDSLTERRTLFIVLVSGTALVLSRQLGLVTMALLTLLLLGLGAWRPVLEQLRHRRPLMVAAVAVPGVATLAVALWELAYDHPVLLGPWLSRESLDGFQLTFWQLIHEGVGWFGWLDVRPPDLVNDVWFAVVVLVVALALVVGDRRDRRVLIGVLLVALVVIYVTYSRVFFPVDGGIQGRHVLPILAVVPVWAGVVLVERIPQVLLARGVRVAAVLLPLVVATGLYLNSQRYSVGLDPAVGLVWFAPEARWSPPGSWYPWLVVGLLGCVGLGTAPRRAVSGRLGCEPSHRPTTTADALAVSSSVPRAHVAPLPAPPNSQVCGFWPVFGAQNSQTGESCRRQYESGR